MKNSSCSHLKYKCFTSTIILWKHSKVSTIWHVGTLKHFFLRQLLSSTVLKEGVWLRKGYINKCITVHLVLLVLCCDVVTYSITNNVCMKLHSCHVHVRSPSKMWRNHKINEMWWTSIKSVTHMFECFFRNCLGMALFQIFFPGKKLLIFFFRSCHIKKNYHWFFFSNTLKLLGMYSNRLGPNYCIAPVSYMWSYLIGA